MRIALNHLTPTPGRPGLRVAELTFTPHPMSKDIRAAIEATGRAPEDLLPTLQGMATMKQAAVIFANGWGMALSTHRPGLRAMKLVQGDERIPTYEVAIFDPDHNVEAIWNDLETRAIENLFEEIAARNYVQVINYLSPDR